MPRSKRGRTAVHLGAPKPDFHLGSRYSTKPTISCLQPEIQRLLPDLFAGKLLAKPNRRSDLRKVEAHVRMCRSCQNLCIERAHREVAVPFLKDAAKRFGITVTQLQRRLEIAAGSRSQGRSRSQGLNTR